MQNGPRHPIERNDYLILTRPIERVMASLTMWIRLNFPGAMIYGQRRRGKSRCVIFIVKYLAATLGYPIAVCVLCARRDRIHEGDFLDDIMDALGIDTPARQSKGKKMEKIRNRLLVLARRCPTRKVVFIIDDGQRLNTTNYEVLMSLFNELDMKYQVNLFVLLVGQPELKTKKDLFLVSGQEELVARMMPDEIEFTGHRSVEEVEFTFDRFDNHSFFPRKSKTSYTEWFARDAVNRGWTLKSEAPGITRTYTAEREARNLLPANEISMHALTTMMHFILLRYASRPGFTELSETDLSEIVQAAGFLQIETPGAKAGEGEVDEGEDDGEER